MSDLSDLARDLGDAAREAPAASSRVVHHVAEHVAEDAAFGQGQVVTVYPGPGAAHLGGVDALGTNPEALGSPALTSVQAGELGQLMGGELLDAGVELVTGR